ncbi:MULTISPECIES: hypothetical protein [unclassified Sphingomonas]|uniref:hypothetical protein n=1 Tax=unclassified Sphingomonas TaxID=196159 RepID=UPI0021511357|nr:MULTISPECIES: hypothetical protein [unclassified Sphingomonas]MCR5872273.1 hypothetical protein [Sphingomonas sp. J344]UUX99428.1 hypothetical protein LRS08_18615 [Sphingomonas sp. J315]
MARFNSDGTRQPTNLFECAAWHIAIQVICRRPQCRRVAVFDPHQLWWLFERKHWDMRLGEVNRKLRCSACKAGGTMSLLRGEAKATVSLPWPDEREWKRAVSRFRA